MKNRYSFHTVIRRFDGGDAPGHLAAAPPAAADQGQNDTANNASCAFRRYRADYRVNANATNVKAES